jgi:uncharacterized protein YukE
MTTIKYDPATLQTAMGNVQRTQAQLLAKGTEFATLWAQVGAVFTGATAAGAAAIHQHIHTAHTQGAQAIGQLGGAINVADTNLGSADAKNAASWSGGARG